MRTKTVLLVALLLSLCAIPALADVSYLISVDTSSVNGSTGFLDFQFNPGNGTSQAATAQIQSFTGGTLNGSPQVSGGVSGTLPGTVNLVNSTALNEYFQSFTYGSAFSFLLTLGGPAVNSPNGTSTAGTTFGVGLYDSGQNPILTNQDQASGFAGEVDINLDGSTTPTPFPSNHSGGASVVSIQTVTPEPASIVLFVTGFAALVRIGRGRRV